MNSIPHAPRKPLKILTGLAILSLRDAVNKNAAAVLTIAKIAATAIIICFFTFFGV